MGHVVLNDWKTGLEKVSLTKLQIDLLNLKLKEAKTNVDNLLEKKVVTIEVFDDVLASRFVEEANKIGAICYYNPL